ncbi:hypothetical protein DN402_18060 [Streptomyces sp. SW4]|nr:hypothetical protein DN402_18060 [Streptomyces sp. SW4]
MNGQPDDRRLRLLALVGVVACAVVLPYAVATAGSGASRDAAGSAVPVLVPADGKALVPGDGDGSGSGDGGPDGDGDGGDGGGRDRGGDGGGESGTGEDGRAGGPVGGPAFATGLGSGLDEGLGSGAGSGAGSGLDSRPGSGPGAPAPHAPGLATAVRCGPELASPGGIEAQTCVLTQGEETWARTYYRNATGGALDAVLTLMGPGDRTVHTRCAVGAEDEPGSCETPRERARGAPSAYTAVAEFADRAGYGPLLLRSGSNRPENAGS